MMLEGIGFYTLSDRRAAEASVSSPLWRCELILTDRCNFKCPYCRGASGSVRGDMAWSDINRTLKYWIKEGLVNVRFSGGEPTLHPDLLYTVRSCEGVERIAVSTNGSALSGLYVQLMNSGVNDFSVSLDACCSSVGHEMSGVPGAWERACDNIRMLAEETYVTVGMVFTPDNVEDCVESVMFAHDLGVADIRVIPSAQYNAALRRLRGLPDDVLDAHPILRYRINNIRAGRHVRGFPEASHCWLALDDMAVSGDWHYPCIIYMREGGRPIGEVGPEMRVERKRWVRTHCPCSDPICSEMCLDVCVDYNVQAELSHGTD